MCSLSSAETARAGIGNGQELEYIQTSNLNRVAKGGHSPVHFAFDIGIHSMFEQQIGHLSRIIDFS